MGNNLSTFMKNGAQLQFKAGIAAMAAADLVEIGGPGGNAFSVGCLDYAKVAAASSILGQTSVNASAVPGAGRIPMTRDPQGNIYMLGTNSGGNAVVYKSTPAGSTISSQTIDATATSCRTGKMMPLSNGNFAAVYARTAGALYFVVFDAQLNIIAGPTSVATERNNTNVVYHDACELSGGGFAIAYQTSANTSISLQTYSNAGVAVLGATNIQTLASTAADCFIRMRQLGNGNLVVAFRSAMTAGGVAGTSFVVVTTGGAPVAGPTNMDSTATFGFLELSHVTTGNGYFAIAEANGTNLKCAVYSAAGVLQGGVYSTADTLNSTTYPQVKLVQDGTQFWLAYFGSVANGLNVVQVPVTDATAGKATTGMSSATLNATTYALDAEVINGMLVALAASSATAGQYYMTVGLPDASLGITAPYLRTGATAFGTAAGTTGSNWPRVLSGGGGLYGGSNPPTNYPAQSSQCGDWTAILAYDQQNTAATYLGIVKLEASAVVGVSQSTVAVGSQNTYVSLNGSAGAYPCNMTSGTPGATFNHSQGSIAGAIGTLYPTGISITSGVSSSSSGLFSGAMAGVGTVSGVGGSMKPSVVLFDTVAGTRNYTVPTGVYKIRAFVGGGGGGGGSTAGGCGGGYSEKVISVTPGQVFSYTVGAAGVGGSSPTAGGTSSFGGLISATGGAANATTGAGTGSGGDINTSGGVGGGGGGASGHRYGNGGNGTGSSGGGGGWMQDGQANASGFGGNGGVDGFALGLIPAVAAASGPSGYGAGGPGSGSGVGGSGGIGAGGGSGASGSASGVGGIGAGGGKNATASAAGNGGPGVVGVEVIG